MTKAVFLFNPQSDAATLTGGNWKGGDTALGNVQNDRYWRVARTASLLATDTQFDVDCRALRTAHGFAIIVPNATTKCRVRVTAFPDVSYVTPSFQSGWQDAGVAGYAWKDEERAPIISGVFAQPVTSRFWRVEIEDPDNLYGHIDVARFFLGEGLSPTFNYAYGATLTFKNNALSSATLSGGLVHKRRVNPRLWQCNFEYLPDPEVFGEVYDFLRYVGFDREVFILPDPQAVSQSQARSFFGTISQLDPLTQAVVGRSSFGFGVEEKVAHASVRGDVSLLPYDRLKISDFAPRILTSAEVTVPASASFQRDYTVTITTGVGIRVPTLDLAHTDFAPAIAGGVVVDLSYDDLYVRDFSPLVGVGQIVRTPASASLQVDYSPIIASGASASTPSDTLLVADFAPTLSGGYAVSVPAVEYNIRDFAPAVASGGGAALPASMQKIRSYTPQIVTGVNVHVPVSGQVQTDFEPLFGAGVFVLIADASRMTMRDAAPSIAAGAMLLIPTEQTVMRDFAIERLRGFGSGYDAGFN